MNGKRIMGAGAAILVFVLLMGIVGNVVWGDQEGGSANVAHWAQMAVLALGIVTFLAGAATYLLSGRRSA